MKYLFLLLLVVSLSGCKTPCNQPDSASALLSSALQSSWDCKGVDAMRSDLNAWLSSLKLCDNNPQMKEGTLSMMICPALAEEVRKLAAQKIPATWQCDQSKIGVMAAEALSAVCGLIPF